MPSTWVGNVPQPDRQLSRPTDLTRVIEAERAGAPFLVYRDGEGDQQIFVLTADSDQVHLGRDASCDVALSWDATVSRVHAELQPVGNEWVVLDDGMSLNGTWVNTDRVVGRHRLRDRDTLKLGDTTVIFRAPTQRISAATHARRETVVSGQIPPTQRRVLVALCRPILADPFAAPATNDTIAAEVFLSVPAVKTHLRSLYTRFDISDLPQNQKRAMLAHLAVEAGVVSPRDTV
jgi:pSer/pThr/pTyr-binding forkhead associated (FHA) protein